MCHDLKVYFQNTILLFHLPVYQEPHLLQKIFLDFKFIVKLEEYVFWQRSWCSWCQGGPVVKECHSWRIVVSLFTDPAEVSLSKTREPGVTCAGRKMLKKMTKSENMEVFASIFLKTVFHSVTWLLHKPVRSLPACSWSNSSIHRCCCTLSKEEIYVKGHKAQGTASQVMMKQSPHIEHS